MTIRACDVDAVRRLIGEAGDDASALVGVSGFSGSDTALLVERLKERVDGSVSVNVDLLADADPREMTTKWATDQRQRLEHVAEPGGVVFVEGRGVLHPDLIRLFRTTIWMDVGIESAVMAGRRRAFLESRSRGGGPAMEWRAHAPEGPVRPRVEADAREPSSSPASARTSGPTSSSSRSVTWRARAEQQARALAVELQEALGPEYRVRG